MIALGDWVPWVLWPILCGVCLGSSGLFSGMEMGTYVLNKIRLELRAESGSRPARTLRRLMGNSGNLLAVLLIGTNVAGYLTTFSISTMFVMAGFGDGAEFYTLAVATPLLLVFGDSVPKGVFSRTAETLVYRLAGVLRAADVLFRITGLSPLVRLVSGGLLRLLGSKRPRGGFLVHEGLPALIAEGHAGGALTQFQSVMADRVMRINDVTLADVQITMQNVVRAPQDATAEQLLELVRRHNYSRIPLTDPAGQVVGVLDVHDVLFAHDDTPPARKAEPPVMLAGDLAVTDALYRMRKQRAAMAIVEDDEANHTGIVTIKDLVEEIVGELEEW